MPPLRNVRQDDAVKAFCRLGGVERMGKGSHRVVTLNGKTLVVPKGILKIGSLKTLIKRAGVSEEEFSEAL